MHSGIKKIARSILSVLGPIPYEFSFWTVVALQKLIAPQAKLGIRNSYRLGYYQPGYSDLDLSLYLLNENCAQQEIIFEKVYRIIRKINPILGEINYYRPQQLEFIQRQHNFLEIARNPDLSVKGPMGLTEVSVFLLRQLEKDIHGLRQHPQQRMRKWNFHLEQLQKLFPNQYRLNPPINPESALENLLDFLLLNLETETDATAEAFRKKLELHLEILRSRVPISKCENLVDLDSWYLAWAPQIVLNSPRSSFLGMTQSQIQFLGAQIHWEICGLITQSLVEADSVSEHISRYRLLLKKLRAANPDTLLHNIEDFLLESEKVFSLAPNQA